MVTIKPVRTANDLRHFLRFPNELYAGNSYFVPDLYLDEKNSLDPRKNPAFEHSIADKWLALRDGKVVGRVMALVNHNVNAAWSKRQARFSRLDFIDDREVSAALLEAAEQWARQQGMDEIVGPMGFSDMDKEGMLIEGFEELSGFVTYYNYPYYRQHLEELGYAKEADWIEFELKVPQKPDERLERIAQMVGEKGGFRLLEFRRRKEILPWAKEIFAVLIEAYRHLYGYVPLTDRQVQYYIDQFFGFVNPNFIKCVLDKEGKIAAVGICLPSLSRAIQKGGGRLLPFGFLHAMRAIRRNDVLDLYLVGVRPCYQNMGVNALLLSSILREALAQGYQYAMATPELEYNEKVQALWKHFERRQHKRRRVYGKKLNA